MANLRLISFSFCVCFLLCCASSLNLVNGHRLPKNHVALFIFGDSLFDAGNNNYFNTTARANYRPYGETFFKYPTGRFSDGRLISDFIAEYAKLPFIPPYLQPDKELTYGVNFASAGAGALAETDRGFVIDLKTQLSHFKDVEKSLKEKLGDAEAKGLISKAVYLFYIGSGDYGAFLAPNSSLPQTISKEKYAGMVVSNLTDTIKGIYKSGGRKFGVLKLGDSGCLPANKARVPGATGACFEEATELAKLHNAVLSKALKEMESKLAGLKLAIHDFFASATERRSNAEKYGVEEADVACCGSGPFRGILSCGGRGGAEYELCSDPTKYWYFDASHITDKAGAVLAEPIWNGSPKITGPYNLKQLFEE